MSKFLQLINLENKKIEIDDSLIDLHDIEELDIDEWQPNKTITPYLELIRVSIDIETTGIEPGENEIKYIGVKIINAPSFIKMNLIDGCYKYFYVTADKTEEMILISFFQLIRDIYSANKVDDIILSFHRGFLFDLPFIIYRSSLYASLDGFCPFQYQHEYYKNTYGEWVKSQSIKNITNRTAQIFGKPVTYPLVKVFSGGYPVKNVAILDTYHLVLQHDFVSRNLTSYSLKIAPYELGLISEPRLELTYKELLEAYRTYNHNLVIQYLKDDLDATMVLLDFLAPAIYYQKLILSDSWKLQTISHSGNGSKWNSILKDYYGEDFIEYHEIEADDQVRFEGGFTKGYAGLYSNVAKIDVASLYPTIMLTYGIYPFEKDVEMHLLKVLKYLRNERLRLKKLAKHDKNADLMQGSYKVMINSAYGFLGVGMTEFNDYKAASLVTAIGRKVIKVMSSVCDEVGGISIELDTDGLLYGTKGDISVEKIYEACQNALPENIELELELKAEHIYIPPRKNSDEGQTKNYIIFNSKDNIKVKGRFRKRDKCWLEKNYHVELLKAYFYGGGYDALYDVHCQYRDKIKSGKIDSELLKITRKVRSNEKEIYTLAEKEPGLIYPYYPDEIVSDTNPLMTTYYISDDNRTTYTKTGKISKAAKKYIYSNGKLPYSGKYYIEYVNSVFCEIAQFIDD